MRTHQWREFTAQQRASIFPAHPLRLFSICNFSACLFLLAYVFLVYSGLPLRFLMRMKACFSFSSAFQDFRRHDAHYNGSAGPTFRLSVYCEPRAARSGKVPSRKSKAKLSRKTDGFMEIISGHNIDRSADFKIGYRS